MMTKLLFFVLFIFTATNFAQKPERVTGEEITGTLFRYKNFNSTFVETRNVDVWLPANYSKNKKYAVLYFHDGQNLFNPKDTYGGVDWNKDATLQRLMTEKKVRDTIVVGIWNTAKRTIEYSPQKAYDLVNHKGVKKSKYVTRQEGLSDKYLKFIVSELKPFIDKTYSTKPDRDNTFVMGSSMGGRMSLYAISEYPQIFGGAGCVSTHFPLGEGVMIEYMKEKLPSPKNHKI
ncbi:MAG: alpha/beta hydrolase [Pyrinomonadaceae bacterium]